VAKIIYLANPYGFSKQQRALLLPPIVQALQTLGIVVWEPFKRNNQIDFSEAGWAYRVAQADFQDVKACDGIFAIVNGTPPDEGVMVELGMAIALNKAVFLFRDDFRRCTDSEQYPLNLMIFAGLPENDWQDFYYTSVEEISSTQKAIYTWSSTAN
jgi:nucleoside 2-deoxyribosyltransferase